MESAHTPTPSEISPPPLRTDETHAEHDYPVDNNTVLNLRISCMVAEPLVRDPCLAAMLMSMVVMADLQKQNVENLAKQQFDAVRLLLGTKTTTGAMTDTRGIGRLITFKSEAFGLLANHCLQLGRVDPADWEDSNRGGGTSTSSSAT